MRIPILRNASAKTPSADRSDRNPDLRVGIPRILNQWSTPRFWTAFFEELGVKRRNVVYSSATSDAQQKQYSQGRGAVDCCYPVKCISGHYGELLTGLKKPVDVLFSPKVVSLRSFLGSHVVDCLGCPRVMAGPESARGGFVREGDSFAASGVRYVSPVVNMSEPMLLARQLTKALEPVFPGLSHDETLRAIEMGWREQDDFDAESREVAHEVLERCERESRPAILALGRPYHMDPGIGHEIENELQACGYPVIWGQHLPLDTQLLDRLFGKDIRDGSLASHFDISDVWKSSYSANTNELIWAARFGARHPAIAAAVRFSSYECGMDQPTYTPVQKILEARGTLFFSFQDLDATKPSGSVRIRTETISYYLERHSKRIMDRKRALLSGDAEKVRVLSESDE
ncbi:MAG: acyl-CoA dehydratase activase-related protein [Paracoccaceae bacterium]|nr:acyl-CoA dehydratase activase-related protein [Paracoccaceae bacterium]